VSNKYLRAAAVLQYWARLFGLVTSAEDIAAVFLPVKFSVIRVLPALSLISILYLGSSHAFYILSGDTSTTARQALSRTFMLLFTSQFPDEGGEKEVTVEIFCQVMVITFTIGFLNIFISVVGDSFSSEKDRFDMTFARERSIKTLSYLLRAEALTNPSYIGSRGVWALYAAAASIALGVTVYGEERLPGNQVAAAFAVVVATLNIVSMQVASSQQTPWPTLAEPDPKESFLWLVQRQSDDSEDNTARKEVSPRSMEPRSPRNMKDEAHDAVHDLVIEVLNLLDRIKIKKRQPQRLRTGDTPKHSKTDRGHAGGSSPGIYDGSSSAFSDCVSTTPEQNGASEDAGGAPPLQRKRSAIQRINSASKPGSSLGSSLGTVAETPRTPLAPQIGEPSDSSSWTAVGLPQLDPVALPAEEPPDGGVRRRGSPKDADPHVLSPKDSRRAAMSQTLRPLHR
jgi:hypothetical protein